MRNAIAAVAAADNWRNALREPLERISLVFIRPSSNSQIFSRQSCRRSVAARRAGYFTRPTPHYSTESRDDLRASCKTERVDEPPLTFWMEINEEFDGEDRIDFPTRS